MINNIFLTGVNPFFNQAKKTHLDKQNKIPSFELSFLGVRDSVSISNNLDDKLSFEAFNIARLRAGIVSLEDLKDNIKPENMLGSGMNSVVYNFNSPLLKGWVLKVDKRPFLKSKSDVFKKSKDVFGSKNMGQEIATVGDRYRILKKIEGKAHSVYDWSYHVDNYSRVTRQEALEFLDSIAKIADFQQNSFDDYADKLSLLSKKGYKQDSINPNNILINYDKKEIHIIDFFKADDSLHINTGYDLAFSLLDFLLFAKFFEKLNDGEQKEFINCAKIIINKCKKASLKKGVPWDEEIYLNFLKNVDKCFGAALADMGGDCTTRYKKLKQLFYSKH